MIGYHLVPVGYTSASASFKAVMISFLSRDPSNHKRIAQLQLEAEALNSAKKAKKQIAQEKRTAQTVLEDFRSLPARLPFCVPTSSNSSVMVDEIICEFMQVPSFASLGNFTPNSEDDRTFEIPPSVKLVMERIVGDIEIKYGKKNPATKVKFVGRIKKPHLTWKQRADIIYFMLHPGFANKDVNLKLTRRKGSPKCWVWNFSARWSN